LGSDAVQEFPAQERAAEFPVPLGALQPVQSHAVQHDEHDGRVQCGRPANEYAASAGDGRPLGEDHAGFAAAAVLGGPGQARRPVLRYLAGEWSWYFGQWRTSSSTTTCPTRQAESRAGRYAL